MEHNTIHDFDVPLKLSIYRSGVEATLERRLAEQQAALQRHTIDHAEAAREAAQQWAETTFGPQFKALSLRLQAEMHRASLRADCSEDRLEKIEANVVTVQNDIEALQTRAAACEQRLLELESHTSDAGNDRQGIRMELAKLALDIEARASKAEQRTASAEVSLRQLVTDVERSIAETQNVAAATAAAQATAEAAELRVCEQRLQQCIEDAAAACRRSTTEGDEALREQIQGDIASARRSADEKVAESFTNSCVQAKNISMCLREELRQFVDRVAAGAKEDLGKVSRDLAIDVAEKFDASHAHVESIGINTVGALDSQTAVLRGEIAQSRDDAKRELHELRNALAESELVANRTVEELDRRLASAVEKKIETVSELLQREIACMEVASKERDEKLSWKLGEEARRISETAQRGDEMVRLACDTAVHDAARKAVGKLRDEVEQSIEATKRHAESLVKSQFERSLRSITHAEDNSSTSARCIAADVFREEELPRAVADVKAKLDSAMVKLSTRCHEGERQVSETRLEFRRETATLRSEVCEVAAIATHLSFGVIRALQIVGILGMEGGSATPLPSSPLGDTERHHAGEDRQHQQQLKNVLRVTSSLAAHVTERWNSEGLRGAPPESLLALVMEQKADRAEVEDMLRHATRGLEPPSWVAALAREQQVQQQQKIQSQQQQASNSSSAAGRLPLTIQSHTPRKKAGSGGGGVGALPTISVS